MENTTKDEKRSTRIKAEKIIAAIKAKMIEEQDQVNEAVWLPSYFEVYLNPEDYRWFDLLDDKFAKAVIEALNNERKRLEASGKPGLIGRLSRSTGTTYEPVDEWQIALMEKDDVIRGEVQVEPLPRDPRKGKPTERGYKRTKPVGNAILIEHSRGKTRTRQFQTGSEVQPKRGVATIRYNDIKNNSHEEIIRKTLTIIGREVDEEQESIQGVQLENVPEDISREHIQIRFDRHTGTFYLTDLSKFGTTLDGREVTPGVEYQDDNTKKYLKNAEEQLPLKCVIGLADKCFIDFEVIKNQ
jgi:hypothetical protein